MDERKKGMLFIFVCACLWSFTGLMTKLIPWNPIMLAGWRALASGSVMFVYMKMTHKKIRINKQSLLVGASVASSAFLCIAGHRLTTTANAVVLQYTAPVFLVILSKAFLKIKYFKKDYIVVAIVMAGIVLFFLDELSPGNRIGNICALVSGVTYACMFLFTGNADEEMRYSGILIGAAMTFVVGAPFTFKYAYQVTPVTFGLSMLMGSLIHGLPYVFYAISFKSCPPLACSMISSVEIILNPVWVFIAVGEVPGKWAFIGAVVIVATILLWIVSNSRDEKKLTEGTG
ncbi:MAG: EamA family transporter [Firmicutes bacterium]|nr:EamA family transporter [Bacillota bacterium]MBR2593701.1 EamA family transporter [Bacillota bacterium]